MSYGRRLKGKAALGEGMLEGEAGFEAGTAELVDGTSESGDGIR